MKVAILQPSYIPWRGYFHIIQKADVFVFYDCVQYDHHGWRNRNKIMTKNGVAWLTIPVVKKGVVDEGRPIREVKISWAYDWARKHRMAIEQSYSKSRYYELYAEQILGMFSEREEFLSAFTIRTTETLAEMLGIVDTSFVRSSEMQLHGSKTERLLGALTQLHADQYISGPSARSYLDEDLLRRHGITVEYMDYNYPEYRKNPANDNMPLSIVDLLFHAGPESASYIWGTRPASDRRV